MNKEQEINKQFKEIYQKVGSLKQLNNLGKKTLMQKTFSPDEREKYYSELKKKCLDQRKKIKTTINKLKIAEEEKINKLRLRLVIVEKRREQKSLEIINKIESRFQLIQNKKQQQQSENLKDKQKETIKDIFERRRDKHIREEELKRYTLPAINIKELNPQNISNQQQGFFNLTSPGQFSNNNNNLITSIFQEEQKNIIRKSQKAKKDDNKNPFVSKELWDKVLEAEKNGQKKVQLPGIGIQKTPIYVMNQIQDEQIKKKQVIKQQILKDHQAINKKEKINFNKIYKNVNKIYQNIAGGIDGLFHQKLNRSASVLDHKLETIVGQAKSIWGDSFLPNTKNQLTLQNYQRNQSFSNFFTHEKTIENLLEDDLSLQNVKKRLEKPKYIFTKKHIKVKLDSNQ